MACINEELLSKMDALESAQKKGDFSEIAKYYFEIGKYYREHGNTEKAIYYLERFDNLVSGANELYIPFMKEDDIATEWICDLQISNPPAAEIIRKEVDDKMENLDMIQRAQWNLLTMARCNVLFHKFSKLPAFHVLIEYENILDLLMKGIYGHLEEFDEDALSDFCDELEEFIDSEATIDNRNRVSIDNGADFVVSDLESDEGTLHLAEALEQIGKLAMGEDIDEADGGTDENFVPNGLFTDYYIRTQETSVNDLPQIQQERERIFADYEFIKKHPDEETFASQMALYKKLALPIV